MTAASILQSAAGGDSTQGTFLGYLSTAMLQAGFNLVTIVSASPTLQYVWSYNTQTGYTYQTLYIVAGFTATSTFECYGCSSYSGSTASNASSTVPTATLNLSSNFNFFAVNHLEMRGVVVFQNGVNIAFIGYFRPFATPSFWSENSEPFAFIPRSMNPWCTNWNGSTGNLSMQPISSLRPSNIGTVQIFGASINASYNSANANSIAIHTPLTIFDTASNYFTPAQGSIANCFAVCDFSTDLGDGPSKGQSFLNYGSNGVNNYTLIDGVANDATWSKTYIKTQ